MSAGTRLSDRDLSDEYPFCNKDVSIQPFRQRRTVTGGDAHRSAPYTSGVPASDNLIAARVIVAEYVNFVLLSITRPETRRDKPEWCGMS